MQKAGELLGTLVGLAALLVTFGCNAAGGVPATRVPPTRTAAAPAPTLSSSEAPAFWLGRWYGSFAGTQEYVTLDVFPGDQFRCSWQWGPDDTCSARGSLRATDRRLELAVEQTDCSPAGSALWEYPELWASAPGVVMLTQAGLEKHIGATTDNQLTGPLWILERANANPDVSAEDRLTLRMEIHEAGMREGEIVQAMKSILVVLRARGLVVPNTLERAFADIQDLGQLEQLLQHATRAGSAEELLQSVKAE